jgi:DnaJ homolog subfamily C member 7
MKLFTKKVAKNHTSQSDDDSLQSDASSPTKSPTKESKPRKKSSRPDSPRISQPRLKPSRTSSRHAIDPGSPSSRRGKVDLDTHPLNLPPEERKRLSALSAMSDWTSDPMDVDEQSTTAPTSPQPPQPAPQASFTVPIPNGAADAKRDVSPPPVPPPHRSTPTSPGPSALDEAEAFKAAGNKLFKEKNYVEAIRQYTKGTESSRLPLASAR